MLRFGGLEGEDDSYALTESTQSSPVVTLQTPTLEYYSGYRSQDLHPLVKRLNFLLTYQPRDKLKAVRTKYSHRCASQGSALSVQGGTNTTPCPCMLQRTVGP